MVFLVFGDKQFELVPAPEPRRADLLKAESIPLDARLGRTLGLGNGLDVAGLWIDVDGCGVVLNGGKQCGASAGDQVVQPLLRPPA